MALQIRELELDRIPAGSVLAAEIHDGSHGVLLQAGCQLTDAMLQGLRRRGIGSASVFCEEQPDPGLDAARREQIEQRLDRLLRCAGDNIAVGELRQALLKFYLEGSQCTRSPI